MNHQTSKSSKILFLIKIALWVFLIRWYEGGIGNFKRGDFMMVCLFEREWLDDGFMKGFFFALLQVWH
jgi:hypothetical protein